MILLSVSEDLSIMTSLLQSVAALGTFGLLYATFNLQYKMVLEQQKVTSTQINQLNIEVMRHRKEITPRFDFHIDGVPKVWPSSPHNTFFVVMEFMLQDNPATITKFKAIKGPGEFELGRTEWGNFSMQPKDNFAEHFTYTAEDGKFETLRNKNFAITYFIEFTDVKGNCYNQLLIYMSNGVQAINVIAPRLVKAVDITH